MSKLKLIILIFALIANFEVFSQNEVKAFSELKVLSWNIYMLPSPFLSKGKIERANLIADIIKKSDIDIVVFQEAFSAKARSIIWNLLKDIYPYQLNSGVSTNGISKINSGLWVVSKTPVNLVRKITFKEAKGFDFLSKKGAILFGGNYKGTPFQIIATHLQAGKYQKIRERQYDEITRNLIEPFKKDSIPLLICGDFNIDKSDKDVYNRLLKKMSVTNYDLLGNCQYSHSENGNDFRSKTCHNQYLFDYIFVRDDKKRIKNVKRSINVVKRKWSRKHQDLSDHYGVLAEIQFN